MADAQGDLQRRITTGVAELHALLRTRSTHSVASCCFSYDLGLQGGEDGCLTLTSPAKQLPFMLSLLLTTPEPNAPERLNQDDWERVKTVLEDIYSAYFSLYAPSVDNANTLSPTWLRNREVSMAAFLHFLNNGVLATELQIADRVERYLAPFDEELKELIGISASKSIKICHWICGELQSTVDNLRDASEAERECRMQLLQQAKSNNWTRGQVQAAAEHAAYGDKYDRMYAELSRLGEVRLSELRSEFQVDGNAFIDAFGTRRGGGAAVRYPTDSVELDEKPLILLDEETAMCPSVMTLFNAPRIIGERVLSEQGSRYRARFFKVRDNSLEAEAQLRIRPFLSGGHKVLSNVYEASDCQNEHDIVVIDQGLILIIEAKATPPREPFRDPDRAYVRLRDDFRSDTGIQKAHDQADRILSRVRSGAPVSLYDGRGREVANIRVDDETLALGVCLTRDSFGPLATNLSLLLEKDVQTPYPWAIDILDLENMGAAWSYFKWGLAEFKKYLSQRVLLHGKVVSHDELDYVGYFIKHGSFDGLLKMDGDYFFLIPEYSKVFDDIYYHVHHGGPPVVNAPIDPVFMDVGESLARDTPVFSDTEMRGRNREKVGRNDPCICGSGKKYKRCCGQQP